MRNPRMFSIVRRIFCAALFVIASVYPYATLHAQELAVDGLSSPQDMKFDSSGNLFIANSRAGTIVEANSTPFTTLGGSSYLDYPAGIAVDGSDNIYTIDSGIVFVLDIYGDITNLSSGYDGESGEWDGGPDLAAAGIPAFDPTSGTLYVISGGGTAVSAYDGSSWSTIASVGNNANGLAVDSVGNLYIAGACSISVMYTGTSAPAVVPEATPEDIYELVSDENCGGSQTLGLAVDGAGSIFYSLYAESPAVSKIMEYTSSASTFLTSSSCESNCLAESYGLTFDSSGDLWIANTGANDILSYSF